MYDTALDKPVADAFMNRSKQKKGTKAHEPNPKKRNAADVFNIW